MPAGPRAHWAGVNRAIETAERALELWAPLYIRKETVQDSHAVGALRQHAESHLIDDELEVDESWLQGERMVVPTSGASPPDELVHRLVAVSRARDIRGVGTFEGGRDSVRFMSPREVRLAVAAVGPRARAPR